jgi:hypothetical protein
MSAPDFLLGSSTPSWLARARVTLFVSDTRLRDYKRFPWRATAPWALDSGGFSQLQKHGRWTITPEAYAHRVRRYRDEIGGLMWAAPQDEMCEPAIIHGGVFGGQRFAGTRQFIDPDHVMTDDEIVAIHQRNTVLNALQLRDVAPDLPWIYVVQGHTPQQYLRHVDLYWELGRIDLTTLPLVGVGSVCRRQAMEEAGQILTALHHRGVTRLHGFGFKVLGLRRFGHLLASADSMAWSDDARRKARTKRLILCGTVHPRGAKNCANCLPYALQWRSRLITGLDAQLDIFAD